MGDQVSDQAAKKWVESVNDACYDLIDAFEELNLREAKIKSRVVGHPLSFSDLRTGLHKARGIVDQIHVSVAKNAKVSWIGIFSKKKKKVLIY